MPTATAVTFKAPLPQTVMPRILVARGGARSPRLNGPRLQVPGRFPIAARSRTILFRRRFPCRAMQAYVYKSQRRPDTYVYMAGRDDFSCLPAPLREQLGELALVLEFELGPGRELATEDPDVVRRNLADRGFHLQVPPSRAGDPMTDDWGTDA